MTIAFNKYQGTGNDFIIIDNRKGIFNPSDTETVRALCDRRFGIGADGLMLISEKSGFDFEMKYFNSDGNESTMCGNGGRCAAAFALRHDIAGKEQVFRTIDGTHKAIVSDGSVRLQMNDVSEIKQIDGKYFINTGSPHYIIETENAAAVDVKEEGRKVGYSATFAPGGTNVNFVEYWPGEIFVRTYERGVEDETLSCGTGVTASAIASVISGHIDKTPVKILTKGGRLTVEFTREDAKVTGIWLTGPATFVFDGLINIRI